ncbi:protein of unknown function [Burkholderia multivorans]
MLARICDEEGQDKVTQSRHSRTSRNGDSPKEPDFAIVFEPGTSNDATAVPRHQIMIDVLANALNGEVALTEKTFHIGDVLRGRVVGVHGALLLSICSNASYVVSRFCAVRSFS